jgi:hypothetical protein
MSTPGGSSKVERLFPFVLRARKLIVGRDNLFRKKGRLHFILITTDISENSYNEITNAFREFSIVQRYTSAEIEQFFQLRNTKVIGFIKSTLSTSLYEGLKEFKINTPVKREAAPAEQKTESTDQ